MNPTSSEKFIYTYLKYTDILSQTVSTKYNLIVLYFLTKHEFCLYIVGIITKNINYLHH